MPDFPSMTVVDLAAYGLMVAALLAIATAWIGRGGRLPQGAVAFVACSMLAKVALVGIAHRHEGFAQKQAADIPVVLWANAAEQGPSALASDPTFALTAVAAAPGFAMAGPNYQAAPVAHSAAIGLAAAIVAASLGWGSMSHAAWWVLVLLTWSPSSVYWGLHGLRDPMILLATSLGAAGALRIAGGQRGGWGGLPWTVASTAMLLIVRPEICPLPAVAATVAAFASSKARDVRPAVAVGLIAGALAAPVILQSELGIAELSAHAISEAASAREARALNQGNESSLYGAGSLVPAAPAFLPARIGVQFVGLLACPLPRFPRGAMDAAVLAESTAWIAALAVPWITAAHLGRSARSAGRACSLVAAAGLLAYAPLTVNAGNAFRLRFSILPFVVVAAATPLARRTPVRSVDVGGIHAAHP